MYLHQTSRKNRDGTVVRWLQLAHNVRDPDSGVVKGQSCCLIRTAEIAVGDTWRSNRRNAHDLDRIRLVTLETDAGTVVQRPRLDDKQQSFVAALGLPELPSYYDFQPLTH